MTFTFLWRPVMFERPKHSFRWICEAAHWDRDAEHVVIDDGYQGRYFTVAHVVDLSLDEFRFLTEYGETMIIRALRPGDLS